MPLLTSLGIVLDTQIETVLVTGFHLENRLVLAVTPLPITNVRTNVHSNCIW